RGCRAELSNPDLATYFGRLELLPGEGAAAEVNLLAPSIAAQAAAHFDRGFFTTIDYGYEAPQLYAPWRKQGTLLCFYNHGYSDSPYQRIGRQDITSHVDFTSLRNALPQWSLLLLTSQMEFLHDLGINNAQQVGLPLEETMSRRRVAQELLDPAGLGRLRVQVLARGVDRSEGSFQPLPGQGPRGVQPLPGAFPPGAH
ncbi:MAG: hypothetical protein GEU28_13715, partial [Dehalococcoidia bacterium]|nr:hypothetical protein [Dehalococcoidia bacterium]